MIDYERLEVSQCALELVRLTAALREVTSKGSGDLVDQFRRATLSVVLNIAEGAGKAPGPDRQRFYAISRGSAFECGALLDIFQALGLLSQLQHHAFKNLLQRIIAMLSSLTRKTG